jgi:thioredoxin reductase/Pyruvate/2-oxoacid:ferredoxin oxidoreductase delta subunit/bacterioferritin-associated ferredoxin
MAEVRLVNDLDVLVVGGGPAGLSTAIEISKSGLSVVVVDEGVSSGGQLVKQTHKFFGNESFFASVRGIEIAQRLIEELSAFEKAQLLSENSVMAVYSDGVPVLDMRRDSTTVFRPKKIVLATGASEKFLQFENNDLPGVYGAGAVQTLMNQYGIIPGKSVLMIGSGNIGLIVAYQLMQAGIEVRAIIEASNEVGGYQVHADKVKRLGIPVELRHTILKAIGEDTVRGAVVSELDDRWRPIAGTEREFAVDTICIAVGLSPSTELAAQAGCKIEYIQELGGYVPSRDENMRTSVPDVFVAGDVSGIEEATTAMMEGKIAGLSIIKDLTGNCDEELLGSLKDTLASFRSGPKSSRTRDGLGRLGIRVKGSPFAKRQTSDFDKYVGKLRPIIECLEAIPCNPCETSCPFGAITVGKNVNNIPAIDYSKCSGCGICATSCPGLAIFMFKENEDGTCSIGIPYEFLPIPSKGQHVTARGRNGEFLCSARVERVTRSPNNTNLVYINVSSEVASDVRSILVTSEDAKAIVCRCEEVSVDQIRKAIKEGYTDFEELRRYLRISMGPCGGRTCRLNTLMILSKETGISIEKLSPGVFRPPAVPVSFRAVAESRDDDCEE